MAPMPDPRVFFASERTLLAWVRSGLTVMALGFVVSRFGLFLALPGETGQPAQGPSQAHWLSNALGIALVLLGSGVILGALLNHRSYIRTLSREDRPDLRLPWLASALALSLAVVGLVLALYLALV
jgi:putative membrane protein